MTLVSLIHREGAKTGVMATKDLMIDYYKRLRAGAGVTGAARGAA